MNINSRLLLYRKMKKGIRGWSFDGLIGFVLVGVVEKI
jgi:hypothetical protein